MTVQKHVVHTIGSLASAMGGPSRTVPRLCAELAKETTWHPTIVTCEGADGKNPPNTTSASGWAFLRAATQTCQGAAPLIVHDHGAWRGNNVLAALAARRTAAALVISPRGMLEPWALAHGRRKKQLALLIYQSRVLHAARAFHATSDDEATNLRALGLTQPIAVIPNGVDVPSVLPLVERPGRRALFLSRLNIKKGIVPFLHAWRAVQPPGWHLLIAGPDEGGYAKTVAAAIVELGLAKTVTLRAEVSDNDKWALYASARMFVLPSFSENFGVVVAEALAAGIPALTTTGMPWADVVDRDCGWQAEPDFENLQRILASATACSDVKLAEMGQRGRQWMQEKFTWHAVGCNMGRLYDWLAVGAPEMQTPEFVVR